MRVMVLVKATVDSEQGLKMTPETRRLFADMGKFNEELVKAGIMKSGDGLTYGCAVTTGAGAGAGTRTGAGDAATGAGATGFGKAVGAGPLMRVKCVSLNGAMTRFGSSLGSPAATLGNAPDCPGAGCGSWLAAGWLCDVPLISRTGSVEPKSLRDSERTVLSELNACRPLSVAAPSLDAGW